MIIQTGCGLLPKVIMLKHVIAVQPKKKGTSRIVVLNTAEVVGLKSLSRS